MEGNIIHTVYNPKIHGVTYDNLLHFAAQATNINAKVMIRNNLLKALASTTWGIDKKTIITIYKAIERSFLDYAAPIWTSFLSD